MNSNSKIFVAGHRGLVGSAITLELKRLGYKNLLLETHSALDLSDQAGVKKFFDENRPEYVFLAAGKVGGICANAAYSAEFIYQNLMIETNIIHQAYAHQVKKLVSLGSSCIYPKFAKQPITERELLNGYLEPTNEAYAIAKIAGVKMCAAYNQQYGTDFLALMPTNLYGPRDNFDLQNSHVLPALMRKIHEAKLAGKKEVMIWGSGKSKREFLYSEDFAEACVFFMEKVSAQACDGHVNVGVGQDNTIKELAILLAEIIRYKGSFQFDTSHPDGTPRKILDVSKQKQLGWSAKTSLRDGIQKTYQWYLENQSKFLSNRKL